MKRSGPPPGVICSRSISRSSAHGPSVVRPAAPLGDGGVTLNIDPDSIYTGALGGATFAWRAVVGRPDELTGTAIVAFVTPKTGTHANATLREALRSHVSREIGALARPAEVRFTDALPKTRSGKIMRRLLRDVASGKETVQDTTTLEDLSVLARLRGQDEA